MWKAHHQFGDLDPSLCRVILGVAKRYLGVMRHQSVWDWEDLVQAGIVGALAGAREYDEGRGRSLTDWIFHYVRQYIIELTRTGFYGYTPQRRTNCPAPLVHGKRVTLAADEIPIRLRGGLEPMDVSGLLSATTSRQRETLRLFYGLDGLRLTAQEIAERRGVKKCTIDSTIRDGLIKMRTEKGPRHGPDPDA